MRIREENCNMVLLAAVMLFAAAVAVGATLLEPTDSKVAQLADRTTAPAQPLSAGKRIISVHDQPPVRVVGAPFVPNTNPRER
jgi:archaellum component FlaG (FlaF/FlaG flagellin family)